MAQTKYTSLSAFIKGVMGVNEPSLTDGERLILFALLSSVDYKSGCSHPGNSKLMEAANRSFRSVQRLLNHLRDKGLVELKSKGDGRSKASIHRFCIEDSRYPKPRKQPRQYSDVDTIQQPRHSTDVVSNEEPRQCSDIVSTENHVIKDEKPRHGETETTSSEPRNHANTVTPLPRISSFKSHPNPPSQAKATEAAVVSKSNPTPKSADNTSLKPNPTPRAQMTIDDYRRKVAKCFFDATKQVLPKASLDRAFLGRNPEKVWLSARHYITSRNWEKLNRPQYFFDSEFEGCYDPDIISPEQRDAEENRLMIEDRNAARAKVVAELEERKRQKEALASIPMDAFF